MIDCLNLGTPFGFFPFQIINQVPNATQVQVATYEMNYNCASSFYQLQRSTMSDVNRFDCNANFAWCEMPPTPISGRTTFEIVFNSSTVDGVCGPTFITNVVTDLSYPVTP